MRKIVLILFILASARVAVYSQNNNSYNNGDDVYYYDDNNNTSNDNNVQQQDDNAPTYQTFYDELSPYGQWVSYPGYGYVWVPNQEPGTVFQPYLTGGHWVYTNYGWTWVSDYAWGWGPFHYGRWLYDAFYGWLWVPGYDWAPAWVVWGDYGGYYCWAPIEPGVVINTHYRPDWHRWYCVPHENITQQEPVHYLVNNDIALKGH
ncbi:MAG TPA: DUF6600 domain-containing protein, partial [Chitinophagales bacterium]|nr:DUF6600 domain-containing protein [Chitinophagales bacterium]